MLVSSFPGAGPGGGGDGAGGGPSADRLPLPAFDCVPPSGSGASGWLNKVRRSEALSRYLEVL